MIPSARRDNISYPHGAVAEDERRRLTRHAMAALVNVVLMCLLAYLVYVMAATQW